MSNRVISLAVVLLGLGGASSFADTYYVNGTCGQDTWSGLSAVCVAPDGPKATIQAALDAASAGDEIVVADGVYTGAGNRNLNFFGKDLTLRSENGADACTIDCERQGFAFDFRNGETAAALVDGFRIRRGTAWHGRLGGGVYCGRSSPTFANCRIVDNEALAGGGLYCSYSSNVTLINCVIGNNATLDDWCKGAGIYCYMSDIMLVDCTISGNKGVGTEGQGCGIYCSSSNPVLIRCSIVDNLLRGDEVSGGGIYFHNVCEPTLVDCTIARNTATGYLATGGGLGCYYKTTPTLEACTITANCAKYRGGGIACMERATPVLSNCTITDNFSHGLGSALFCEGGSTPTLTNCILWGDVSDEIYVESGSPQVTYCDVQGGWAGVGNIDSDPLLTPDHHLQAASPCRNAGDPAGDYTGQVDMDAESRVTEGRVDIGADEFLDTDADSLPDWWETGYFGSPTGGDPAADGDSDERVNLDEYVRGSNPTQAPQTYYVDPTGNDTWDGLAATWDGSHGPKVTIQSAVDAATTYEGDIVELASATYTGTGNVEVRFLGKRITVQSTSGDPATCVVDCQGAGTGFHFDVCETAESILHGITITGGDAEFGGAVRCYHSAPTISHCIFSGNTVLKRGGGVYCFNAHPTVLDSLFEANTSTSPYGWGGAAVGCEHRSNPTVIGCTFAGNVAASGGGGGVYTYESDAFIMDCLFVHNMATGGAGICAGTNGSVTVVNSTFTQNAATASGGAARGGELIMANCILWGNTPGEISLSETGTATVSFCDVTSGWPGTGNIDADPLFADADGPDDDPATWTDNDYRLSTCSLCIDAGDNTSVPADAWDLDGDSDTTERVPIDRDGNPRFWNDAGMPDTGVPDGMNPAVDLGAFECQIASPPPCAGDMNCDGVVGANDVDLFVEALGYLGGHGWRYPCHWINGDCNSDGDVTYADIDAFIARLGATCP